MKYATLVLVLLFGTSLDAHAQDRQERHTVVGVAENDTLSVRSRPGESSLIVAKVRNGTTGIEIIGRAVMNGDDDWVPIAISGVRGWVRPKFLSSKSKQMIWADVPIRRAIAANAGEVPSDEAPLSRSETVSSDPYAWVKPVTIIIGAIAALCIINDIISGGDSTSSRSESYDFDRDRQNENYKAEQKGESLPYPGVSAIQH